MRALFQPTELGNYEMPAVGSENEVEAYQASKSETDTATLVGNESSAF